jgi:hypothetical protein
MPNGVPKFEEQLEEIGVMVNTALVNAAEIEAPASVLDALLNALRALEDAKGAPATLN